MKQLLLSETEAKLSREVSLELLRQKLKDYPVIVKAICELSFFFPISVNQLMELNVSDVNIKKVFLRLVTYDPIVRWAQTYLCEISKGKGFLKCAML